MRRRCIRILVGFALITVLASCGFFETRERVVGTFWEGEGPPATVPSEVTRGQPFEVSVSTLGGDCTLKGDTVVSAEGLRANVTPFDIEVTRASPCLLYAQELVHTAKLVFEEAGTATITFHGQNPDISSPEKLVSLERTLSVR